MTAAAPHVVRPRWRAMLEGLIRGVVRMLDWLAEEER